MKKLSKPPEAQKVIHYGSSYGYSKDNGFIFSEELPYKRRKKMSEYMREYHKIKTK